MRASLWLWLLMTGVSSLGVAAPISKGGTFHLNKKSPPKNKPSASAGEASADESWKGKAQKVDRDTCMMAVMHHSRRIHQSLSQTEARLASLLAPASRNAEPRWSEKPLIKGPESRTSINTTLEIIRKAKVEAAPFAGRGGKAYADSLAAAQSHCEKNLVLGSENFLAGLESSLESVYGRVNALHDDGHLEMKDTGREGYHELFLDPVLNAQHNVIKLGKALTTAPAVSSQKKALAKLESELRKSHPSAFAEGKGATAAEQIAVNKKIADHLLANRISYTDAAQLWSSKLVRPVSAARGPNIKGSAAFVDDLIVDMIASL